MKEKKKLDLAALSSIPLIMTLANSMLIPVLPLMQRELKVTAIQTSLIITVYAAVSIVFIPIAGYLSDRFGRKRIILIGLSIAAIGGLVSSLAAWLMNGQSGYYTGSALALVVWHLPLAIIPAISAVSIIAVIFLVKVPKESDDKDDVAPNVPRFKVFVRNTTSLLA
ncbi:MFS transporter [Cohnella soli]|uniref:MFS transporter n=1 Tax=Cohnella soli TaxID=425005 RepID=A0ABW0I1C7_9BACL